MARRARVILPQWPHHILLRGHNRQAVFVDDRDRRQWVELLDTEARALPVALHAWVLLDDRVHLLLTPQDERAPAQLMQALGRRYVRAFNARHERTGTLWDGRFRAALIEPGHRLMDAQWWIEAQPAQLGLVDRAERHAWSTAAHHAGLRTVPGVQSHHDYWALGNTPFEREAAYVRGLRDATTRSGGIARTMQHCRPLADEALLRRLEQDCGQWLQPRPVGRPRA